MDAAFNALDAAYAILLAVGLLLVGLTHKEQRVGRLLLIGAAILLAGRWIMWSFTTETSYLGRGIAGAVIGALLLAGLPALLEWSRGRERPPVVAPLVAPAPDAAAPAAVAQPDVTLKFVYPSEPALVLINNSNKVARDIKWTVLLWNLDNPRDYSNPNDNNTHEPLQIPVSFYDFIRPHAKGGPQNLFGSPIVAPYVKSGDRLIGSASVICAECERGHTFFVYVVFNKGGWYYEIKDQSSGDVVIPKRLTRDMVSDYAQHVLETAREGERVPIEEP